MCARTAVDGVDGGGHLPGELWTSQVHRWSPGPEGVPCEPVRVPWFLDRWVKQGVHAGEAAGLGSGPGVRVAGRSVVNRALRRREKAPGRGARGLLSWPEGSVGELSLVRGCKDWPSTSPGSTLAGQHPSGTRGPPGLTSVSPMRRRLGGAGRALPEEGIPGLCVRGAPGPSLTERGLEGSVSPTEGGGGTWTQEGARGSGGHEVLWAPRPRPAWGWGLEGGAGCSLEFLLSHAWSLSNLCVLPTKPGFVLLRGCVEGQTLPLGWPGSSRAATFLTPLPPATVRCTTCRWGGGQLRARARCPWLPACSLGTSPPRGRVLTASFSWTPTPCPAETQGRRAAELDKSAAGNDWSGWAWQGGPGTRSRQGSPFHISFVPQRPPDPSAHRRGGRGPEKTDSEQRGPEHAHTRAMCPRLPTVLTCSRTHKQGHTQTWAGACCRQTGRPGTAFVLGSLGWVRLACGPLLPRASEGPGGGDGVSPPGHVRGVTWLPSQPGT